MITEGGAGCTSGPGGAQRVSAGPLYRRHLPPGHVLYHCGGILGGSDQCLGVSMSGGGKLRGGEWGLERKNGLLIKLIYYILFMTFFS